MSNPVVSAPNNSWNRVRDIDVPRHLISFAVRRKHGDGSVGIVADRAFAQICRFSAGEIAASNVYRHHRRAAAQWNVHSSTEDPRASIVALVLGAGESLTPVIA